MDESSGRPVELAAKDGSAATDDMEIEDDPKSFVLGRELAEAHLLLDNLSADPDVTLSALSTKEPLPKGLDESWLDEFCRISWPPPNSTSEKASQAVLLIRVKDYLNRLAKPASGLTIAFTIFVTQSEEEARKREGKPRKPGIDMDETRSRWMLANLAYPDLVNEAQRFRQMLSMIRLILVIWLACTCLFSWYVAYGNSALAEYANASKALGEAQARIEADEGLGRAADAAGAASAPAVKPGAAPALTGAAAAPTIGYCEHWRRNAPFRLSDGASLRVYDSAEQLEACRARDNAQIRVDRAKAMLHTWLGLWRWILGVHGQAKAAATAANLASIMGTAMLPVLYGFLGAGAAVLRSLSRKIKTSTLNPRDIHLSLLQLALGAVVGSCIGLFIVDPGEDAALIGPVALSGSAISFIAGFGVEAVFQALEGLISRLFNIAAAGATPSEALRRG